MFLVGFRTEAGGVRAGLGGEQFHLPLVLGGFGAAGAGLLEPGLQTFERGERDGEDRRE
ncbi:hypothetical protein [Streptomyces kronopolitis]